MEFLIGALVGFIVAGLIGRAKFLQVQNKLREIKFDLQERLNIERDLNEGLTQELADRTR